MLTDLDGGRVLDVVEERTTAAATAVLDTLLPAQQAAVVAVAMDMWEPFAQVVRLRLPQADAVHDRFHVSKYLGEAVLTGTQPILQTQTKLHVYAYNI